MSEIEELQLFSAVIFPASDPVVIIKETPTYDTGKTTHSNHRLIFFISDQFLSDCGGAAGLLLGLNVATIFGFIGKKTSFFAKNR